MNLLLQSNKPIGRHGEARQSGNSAVAAKDIADRLSITGAGSIAMWFGIIVATIFMKKRGAVWRGLGLVLPSGVRKWAKGLGLALLAAASVIAFMAFILDPVSTYFGWITPPDAPGHFCRPDGRYTGLPGDGKAG